MYDLWFDLKYSIAGLYTIHADDDGKIFAIDKHTSHI